MIKRIIPIILCLILVSSISVSATNTTEDTIAENSQATEEFPQRQGRPQGGGRGNMGTPPEMPNGEMPPDLPEGMAPPEMQSRENQDEGNVPPQINGQVATENPEQNNQANNDSNADNGAVPKENGNLDRVQRGGGNMGGFPGQMSPGMTEQEQSTDEISENKILTFVKSYSTPITSIVLLLLAFVFVIFYKRKNY